jgi:hypothetical protein
VGVFATVRLRQVTGASPADRLRRLSHFSPYKSVKMLDSQERQDPAQIGGSPNVNRRRGEAGFGLAS